MKRVNINRIIFVLGILGILMAIYVLQSWLRHTGIVCYTGGCDTVQKNMAAWPFGVPVPAVGLVGYSIIAVLAFLRTTSKNPNLDKGILGMAAFGVAFTLWFTYTEVFVIHAVCMWCAISTINMFVLFLFAVKSYMLEAKK